MKLDYQVKFDYRILLFFIVGDWRIIHPVGQPGGFEYVQLDNPMFLVLKRILLMSFLVPVLSLGQESPREPENIKSIYFGGGSYYVDYQQIIELQEFLNSIPHIETYYITVHSHTDNIGGVDYNNWLSQMRSASVVDQLILNEIKSEMIEIKDFGLHNPVYDNSTWEGRIRNRRVDIILHPLVLWWNRKVEILNLK